MKSKLECGLERKVRGDRGWQPGENCGESERGRLSRLEEDGRAGREAQN